MLVDPGRADISSDPGIVVFLGSLKKSRERRFSMLAHCPVTSHSTFLFLILSSNLNRIDEEMISNCREMELEKGWPACLNEYQKLVLRMNTPKLVLFIFM